MNVEVPCVEVHEHRRETSAELEMVQHDRWLGTFYRSEDLWRETCDHLEYPLPVTCAHSVDPSLETCVH